MDRAQRRRLGAYYTPPALVDFLVREVVGPAGDDLGRPPRVVDAACGDGRLLAAAGAAIGARFGVDPRPLLVGGELDAAVAARTAVALGIDVRVGDGRTLDLGAPFDVAIGNPPYLSQLATSTARGGRSILGGGPYADVAAEFLARSLALVRADGGRVGLVLPQSILATRDVTPIRELVLADAALDVFWWADETVFDANVRTCIVGLVRGREPGPVRRFFGSSFAPVPDVISPGERPTWSWLVTDVAGVPAVELDASHGTLGDLAVVTADFRDQFYGLIGHVSDGGDGPPLITSGLIDVGRCRWGEQPVRFAKQRFLAPRVDLGGLSPKLQAWARSRLVPKVLVASQTRVIEAVVDERGEWLPSVPVVSVIPRDPADVWRIGALLTSPVASAWLAGRRLGSGLSPHAIRVSAADLTQVPLPLDSAAWAAGASLLRGGDAPGCAAAMVDAYVADGRALRGWWTGQTR